MIYRLTQQSEKTLSERTDIENWARKLYSLYPSYPCVLGFLVEISEDHLERSKDNRKEHIDFALKVC